jgi:hypothetical protein
VPGLLTDPRAEALGRRYNELFGGEELSVPVESIAEDLLGLRLNENEEWLVSGVLPPAERQTWVTAHEAKEGPRRHSSTVANPTDRWSGKRTSHA